MKKEKILLSDVPLSGDKLLDWVVKQFTFFLKKEKIKIKRKRRLTDKDIDPHRRALQGMMVQLDEGGHNIEVLVNPSKRMHCDRDEETETLIHELCHIVFWKTPERFIGQLESILVKRLTGEQKNFLNSFLPRHEVKN